MWEILRPDRDRLLVVEGTPPENWAELAEQALALNVFMLPRSEADMAVVHGLMRSMRDVVVTCSIWSDVSFMEESTVLEEAAFWPPPERSPRLPETSRLRSFAGGADKAWQSLREYPRLEELYLEGGHFGWVEGAPWRLRRVEFTKARRVRSIPDIEELSQMRELHLHGATDVDASALATLPALRLAAFAGGRRVVLPEVWPADASVRALDFVNVREIVNAEALLSSPVESISVFSERNRPLSREVVEAARAQTRQTWRGNDFR